MKPFGRTLVVKLLGRQPSYGFMVKKLRQIWARKGNIDIFDLANDFYLVNFQHADDYMEALTGGPWVINDAYLNVARWRPEFNPKSAQIESVVAWVRFPDLPAPLFDKKFLLNLGNVIGKAIKLDIHTAQRARGKFARMCVELDLTKPLVPEFEIEGQILSIVYESLGMLCNKCGRFGHFKEFCEDFHKRNMDVQTDVEDKGGPRELWKTMQRPRRPRRNPLPAQPQQSGSRFTVLEGELEEEGGMERSEGAHEGLRAADRQGNVQGEFVFAEKKMQGRSVSKSEGKKGDGVQKPRKMGSSGAADRSVKEGNGRSGLVRSEVRNVHVVLSGSQNRMNSGELVPESNMELPRNKGVSLIEKENLNPGEQGLKRWEMGDMYMGDGVVRDKDPIEPSSMSIEPVYATPVLANPR
ncbi:hypothetical protein K1719_011635 [Acacia pycnantha]|nr:hypothetical protein K1719_011635 [Acacia pycnantha]